MLINAEAKQMIQEGRASCVILKSNEIIRLAKGKGVAPLLSFYENEPEVLKNAVVVDKIIGKAAAMILVLGGAKATYGEVMSNAADAYLTSRGIEVGFGERVDVVMNRTGDGMCPLEYSVQNIDDPLTGYKTLKETIRCLMSQRT